MKHHQWKSSPYWPAKKIWQYTCSNCGVKAVSCYAPGISSDGRITIKLPRTLDIHETMDSVDEEYLGNGVWALDTSPDCDYILVNKVVRE